jgi:hypothetical protein
LALSGPLTVAAGSVTADALPGPDQGWHMRAPTKELDMTNRTSLLAAFACLAFGCADLADERAALPAATNGKADGLVQSLVANHCEVFVDKAAIVSFSQSTSKLMQVYLKVLPERLDGEVVEAGFVGGQTICLSCNVGESGGPTQTRPLQVEAERFFDALDYFEMTLPVATSEDGGQTVRLEGLFYVLTDQGTRYTVRSEPDDHATVDADMDLPAWSDDVGALDPIGWLPTDSRARRQLNPDGCL